jgi:hypothetical protein
VQCVVTQHSWCCEICYGIVFWFTSLCASWNFVSKKSSRTFVDTRTHFAALARACFHESHVWDESLMWVCCACIEERLAHRYARTRRTHSLLLDSSLISASRGRVINAPCDPSAPRVLAARSGLHFLIFFYGLVKGRFSSFFSPLEQLFRHLNHHQHAINIISSSKFVVNTSWNRQNSSTHEKWSKIAVFEGLEKEAQNGCFWPVFDLIKKSRFFWHQHIINTSKNEALKKCLKKMSFWKKSKIF